MVRVTAYHFIGRGKYFEYAGLSTDAKPQRDDIITGSLFLEVDTGNVYAYDEDSGDWNQIAALGGTGTSEVTPDVEEG